MRIFRIALLALLLAHSSTFAQAPTSAPGTDTKLSQYYVNFMAGRFLPYDIYGVRSIVPYWGARFGHPLGDANLEWSGIIGYGRGAKYYDASIALAFPSELEGWKFIPFFGLHTHYYSGSTSSGPLPYATAMGFHFGASPLIEIGPNFALRADFKFNYNPGKSLHVGGGFQYNF